MKRQTASPNPPEPLDVNWTRIISQSIDVIKKEKLSEYKWMFVLVGFLRGIEPSLRATDKRAAKRFLPVAFEFARQLRNEGFESSLIDWEDPASVELEFEKSWASRQFPKGSGFFELAVEISKHDPLQISEKTNSWVARITNLAFCLRELIPDNPILIPVNDRTAELLGTSLRTLSLALQQAISEKTVLVVEKPDQALPARRARRLKFNPKHHWYSDSLDGARKRFREAAHQKLDQPDV